MPPKVGLTWLSTRFCLRLTLISLVNPPSLVKIPPSITTNVDRASSDFSPKLRLLCSVHDSKASPTKLTRLQLLQYTKILNQLQIAQFSMSRTHASLVLLVHFYIADMNTALVNLWISKDILEYQIAPVERLSGVLYWLPLGSAANPSSRFPPRSISVSVEALHSNQIGNLWPI